MVERFHILHFVHYNYGITGWYGLRIIERSFGKSMKSKILSFFVAMSMIISFAVPVSATTSTDVVSGSCGNGITWSFNGEDTLLITNNSGTVAAMDDYGADSVSFYAPWYDLFWQIDTVVIGSGISHVGNSAFSGYQCISRIELGSDIKTIGDYAFKGCDHIVEIYLPDSLTIVGDEAFWGLTSLDEIDLKNIKKMGDGAFGFLEKCQTLTIPEGVTEIPASAFVYSGIEEVEIPSTVTTIGDGAFAYCDNLYDIKIGPNVTSIGESVFYDCDNLDKIKVDVMNNNYTSDGIGVLYTEDMKTLICVPEYAYDGVVGGFDYTVPDTVTEIAKTAFAGNKYIKKVTLPEGLVTIGDHAFEKAARITSVNIPDSVTQLGEFVFYDCDYLEDISIGTGIERIPTATFMQCNSLSSVYLPGNITLVEPRAFEGCMMLTEVEIGEQETIEIARNAFCDTCPETVIWHGGSCIEDADIQTTGNGGLLLANWIFDNASGGGSAPVLPTNVPATTDAPTDEPTDAPTDEPYTPVLSGKCGKNAFWEFKNGVLTISGTGEIDDLEPDDELGLRQPWDDCMFEAEKIVVGEGITSIGNMAFAAMNNVTDVDLPSTLREIGENSFGNCISLKKIDLPEGLLSIGISAFMECLEMESIYIPSSVTSIGDDVFGLCYGLKNITVSEDNSEYASADGVLYTKDMKTILRYPAGRTEESFEIPSGVQTIAQFAFADNNYMTTLIIPKSLKKIDYDAVVESPAFSTVMYVGNESQWNNIDIKEGNGWVNSVDMIYNCYGDGVLEVKATEEGELVKVTVSYKYNPGVAAVGFKLDFDETKLAPVSCKTTALCGMALSNATMAGVDLSSLEHITYNTAGAANVYSDSVLLEVMFEHPSGTFGSTSFTLSYEEGDIGNQNVEVVEPDIVNATLVDKFTIYYELGKDSFDTTVSYGDDLTVSDYIPKKYGYEFIGWSETENSQTKDFASLEVLSDLRDYTLYPVFSPVVRTVSLDSGSDASYPDFTQEFGKNYPTLPVPEKTGHTFVGWFLDDTMITSESVMTLDTDHTLVAKWDTIKYKVSFDAGSDVMFAASQKKEYGVPLVITDTVPTKEGHTFVVWQTSGGEYLFPGDTYTADEELSLSAVWAQTDKMPKLTVNSPDGQSGETVDVTVSVSNNSGISNFDFSMDFDSTAITPVAIEGGVVSNLTTNIAELGGGSTVTVKWDNDSDVTENGILFTIKFKIADDATNCEFPISVKYQIGSLKNAADDTVFPNIEAGEFAVANYTPGNIRDTDGKINNTDAIMLAQHIAGWESAKFTRAQKKAADVHKDGRVNNLDSIKLAQYIANWDVVLGE